MFYKMTNLKSAMASMPRAIEKTINACSIIFIAQLSSF